jgi:phospholipid/cholesterol/gamma-HCH transport system substrate-binding protein
VSPSLRHLFHGLGPFVSAARKGLPATSETLNNTRPVLRRLDPFLRNLTPVLDYLGLYKSEIAAFFANDSAATQFTFKPLNKAVKGALTESNGTMHVLRVSNPLNPEIMAGYPNRLGSNRSNPYTTPGAYGNLANNQPLPVFGSYLCTGNPVPPAPPVSANWPQRLATRAEEFIFGGKYNTGAAPPCVAQAPLGTLNIPSLSGQTGAYPHLQPLP